MYPYIIEVNLSAVSKKVVEKCIKVIGGVSKSIGNRYFVCMSLVIEYILLVARGITGNKLGRYLSR